MPESPLPAQASRVIFGITAVKKVCGGSIETLLLHLRYINTSWFSNLGLDRGTNVLLQPVLGLFLPTMAVQAGQPKGWPVTDEAGLLTLFELPPSVLATPVARSLL